MTKRNLAAVIFFAIVAVFLLFGALMMHPFGELNEENYPEMDEYIIENTQNQK